MFLLPSLRFLNVRERVLSVLVLLSIALQFKLIHTLGFHFDEFNELAHIFAIESGYHMGALRSGMHHFFFPLRWLPLREDSLIIIARHLTFILGALSTYLFTFLLARRLGSNLIGILAVFLLLSHPLFFSHIICYRTDPLNVSLFLGSLWLLTKSLDGKRIPYLLPGIASAVSLFMNAKALYPFAILVFCYFYIWLYSRENKKFIFTQAVKFVCATSVLFLLLTAFHSNYYSMDFSRIERSVEGAARLGFSRTHGWGQKTFFFSSVIGASLVSFVLIFLGLYFELRRKLTSFRQASYASLLAIIALLQAATVLIHQGVYAYYIIDIYPSLAIVGAIPLSRLLRLTGGKSFQTISRVAFWAIVISCLVLGPIRTTYYNRHDSNNSIRVYMTYLDAMFPEMRNYADGFSLLSKRKNVLSLYSGKRHTRYTRAGVPHVEKLFSDSFPAIIVDSHRFSVDSLLQEDQEYIRSRFIPFFGENLWIHGYRLNAEELSRGALRNFRVSGTYTAIGSCDNLLVDSKKVGKSFRLKQGSTRIDCPENSGNLAIVYGHSDPRDIVPMFDFSPKSSGSFSVSVAGRYYLNEGASDSSGAITINGKPLKLARSDSRIPASIELERGEYTFENPLDHKVVVSVLGPVLEHFLR